MCARDHTCTSTLLVLLFFFPSCWSQFRKEESKYGSGASTLPLPPQTIETLLAKEAEKPLDGGA